MIVALTGRIGAGKSEAARALGGALSCAQLSFVERVFAPHLRAEGRPIDRTNLQSIGAAMMREHGDVRLTEMLLDGVDLAGDWLLDDLRYPTTARYLAGRLGSDFVLVCVQTPFEMRYERVRARGRERVRTREDFAAMDSAVTERLIDETCAFARVHLDNSGCREDLRRACLRLGHELRGT